MFEDIAVTYRFSGFPIDAPEQFMICHFQTLQEFITFSENLVDAVECKNIYYEISGFLK